MTKNRKDVGVSIGKKVLLDEARQTMQNDNIFQKIKKVGKKRGNENYFFLLNNQRHFSCVLFVEYKGTNYEIGDFILDQDTLTAKKILEIYIDLNEEVVLLVTEEFKIVYTPHLRSYKVEESGQEIDIHNVDIFVYPPVNAHLFYDNYYIRIKHF